ncbi:DUF3955 domain-containing protein [Desulfotalea psychrophila]|uniref:DUF3955 domain-containing protein n=1 Tax=Desulfotalea psychrophila (strain LSv54 / DSM 12343) TaxID=177439 RepID=Q6ARC9_DESPS|nr:DUF3955 domain-containing protein [Desulfotalea psychrophila]CAG35095.1 unknown protein [Desulfotalea psychrophila LSv54]
MIKIIFSKTLCALLLLASITCMISYRIIGSSIDSEGFLHEPFALIPLGWLFFFLTLLTGGGYLLRTILKKIAQ